MGKEELKAGDLSAGELEGASGGVSSEVKAFVNRAQTWDTNTWRAAADLILEFIKNLAKDEINIDCKVGSIESVVHECIDKHLPIDQVIIQAAGVVPGLSIKILEKMPELITKLQPLFGVL